MTKNITNKIKVDNRLKRRRRFTLIIISIFLFALFFILLLTQTTLFHLKKIEVKGNSIINKEKILLASGINIGENIFKLNTDKAQNNMLKHPYIKEAKISKKYPDKISIKVTERSETLIYKRSDETYMMIDNEGYILNILSEINNETPLLQSNIEIKGKTSEKINFKEYPWVIDILKLLDVYNKNGFSFNIKNIVEDDEHITIILKKGTNIDFGSLNNIEYKLRLIDEITSDLQNKNILPKEIYLDKGKNPIVVK